MVWNRSWLTFITRYWCERKKDALTIRFIGLQFMANAQICYMSVLNCSAPFAFGLALTQMDCNGGLPFSFSSPCSFSLYNLPMADCHNCFVHHHPLFLAPSSFLHYLPTFLSLSSAISLSSIISFSFLLVVYSLRLKFFVLHNGMSV